jgi:hypothetical protein
MKPRIKVGTDEHRSPCIILNAFRLIRRGGLAFARRSREKTDRELR